MAMATIESFGSAQPRDQAGHHFREHGLGEQDLDEEAAADDRDQRQDERFHGADAEALQPQQQQRVGGGEQHADEQRNVEQQVEADGRAQHFGQIAGGDGDFAEHPQRER